MAATKIFIATPAYGQTFYTPCVESLFKLAIELERRKWSSGLLTVSYADIAESRNILLSHWFDKTKASHLLFVDADMGFEPQLIIDMVEFDQPLVGTIYPKRHLDLERFATAIKAGRSAEKAEAGAHDFVVQKPSRGTARNGFIQVDGCGTGILLLQRSCIEQMLHRLPEIVDHKPPTGYSTGKQRSRLIRAFDFLTVDGGRLSEDFSFCYRWREKCGGEVWANISHEITHVGIRHFTARYSNTAEVGVRTVQIPLSGLTLSKMAKPQS